MPDAKGKPAQIDLTIIVNGQPTVVTANENQKLEHVVKEALHQTKTTGRDADQWELRDASGVGLDLDKKIKEFNFVSGTQLFLNLKAGVGG